MVIKASEIRKDWKTTLDRVVQGERIHIERGGVRFVLLRHDDLVHAVHPDLPKIEKNPPISEAAPQIVTTSELGERPCCAGKKPCRHWNWDDSKQVYVNSLSGREMEPES